VSFQSNLLLRNGGAYVPLFVLPLNKDLNKVLGLEKKQDSFKLNTDFVNNENNIHCNFIQLSYWM
jgi:hypothetical protein